MKNLILTAATIGLIINAYGMDRDGEALAYKAGRPLTDMSNYQEGKESKNLYPECSQNIKAEREEAYREGLQEGEHKAMLIAAIKMFRKGGAYTPEIMEFTGITEEQTKEAISKEQGQ